MKNINDIITEKYNNISNRADSRANADNAYIWSIKHIKIL